MAAARQQQQQQGQHTSRPVRRQQGTARVHHTAVCSQAYLYGNKKQMTTVVQSRQQQEVQMGFRFSQQLAVRVCVWCVAGVCR